MNRASWAVALVCAPLIASAADAPAGAAERRVIDLATALRLADRSFDVELAVAREREARALATAADGALLPTVGVGGSVARSAGFAQSAFGDVRDVTFDTYTAAGTVRLAWNVGDVAYRDLAARRRADAATASTTAARQRVVLSVVERYFDLAQATATVAIEERLASDAAAVVRIAATRAEQGAGSRLDRERAAAQAAVIEQQVITARADRERRAAALADALRLDAAVPLASADAEPVASALIDPRRSLEDWLAAARRMRPEATSLSLSAIAARHEASAARWSAFGPEVSLAASSGYLGDTLDSAEDQRRHGWTAGLGWTLSAAAVGRIEAADAREAQARLSAARFEQDVRTAVVTAFAEVRAAREQLAASRREVDAAEAAYDLSRARFTGGVLGETDLLLAEQAVEQARTRRLGVVVRSTVTQARLLAEAGEISSAAIVAGKPVGEEGR